MPTYISLFSSAGVGCFGFKQIGFDCIATNELLPRRLDIQKSNNKRKYPTGYICGDITQQNTKQQLFDEIDFWKKNEKIKRVDVIIATPPCQGMSVANHKKSVTEICRNSLVVESIKIILTIKPKFFIFENVPAFMKTPCLDADGLQKPIEDAILQNLGPFYSYAYKIINFKNYGACSSRQRTLVIGVSKDLADDISPLELYPGVTTPKTIREVIGHLPSLTQIGQIDSNDIFHAFRPYPPHMRNWISSLKEGESAFDNLEDEKKPHQIIDGKLVINQQKNGDKYRRQYWDKPGPCIHTRNDQLASQNTIHPQDDRVFSIRELMLMMTVPADFKWTNDDLEALNEMPTNKKLQYLKKTSTLIRQSIGEAVPTKIFESIATNIRDALSHDSITNAQITKLLNSNSFNNVDAVIDFTNKNPNGLSTSALSRVAEMANEYRCSHAAFYTNKSLITDIIKELPDFDNEEIRILEPSVGVGNFIPLLWKKYEHKKLIIDIVDIDSNSCKIAKVLLEKQGIPSYCEINIINDDFLLHDFDCKYDLVIGNPPFFKLPASQKNLRDKYLKDAINKKSQNLCSYFLDKASILGKYVAMVFPKFLLNTPEYADSRKYLSSKSVDCIIDFGENGFHGVLIETIAILFSARRPKNTTVISSTHNTRTTVKQSYIFDTKLPYWIIYRNEFFDEICQKLTFNVFSVFRDRQITNKLLNQTRGIRVLKSRNISDDGTILNIKHYDSFIDEKIAQTLATYKYLNAQVYIAPNMTYNPRLMKKPTGTITNGSVAILIPRHDIKPTKKQLEYFSSDEYRSFYRIARNFQTRSLNIDTTSVFFFGLLRKTRKQDIFKKIRNATDGYQPYLPLD